MPLRGISLNLNLHLEIPIVAGIEDHYVLVGFIELKSRLVVAYFATRNHTENRNIKKQESLANAKVSARQQ